jgi:hypothetical protein
VSASIGTLTLLSGDGGLLAVVSFVCASTVTITAAVAFTYSGFPLCSMVEASFLEGKVFGAESCASLTRLCNLTLYLTTGNDCSM